MEKMMRSSIAKVNRAPNAPNAIWVRSFQSFYDLFWTVIFHVTKANTDELLCGGMIEQFGVVASQVYIAMFVWSLLNIPISYYMAKEARVTGNIRYPRIVFYIWFLYAITAGLLWLFAVIAVFHTSQCSGQPLTKAVWGYLLLPVVLICAIILCAVFLGFGRGEERETKLSEVNEISLEFLDKKRSRDSE